MMAPAGGGADARVAGEVGVALVVVLVLLVVVLVVADVDVVLLAVLPAAVLWVAPNSVCESGVKNTTAATAPSTATRATTASRPRPERFGGGGGC